MASVELPIVAPSRVKHSYEKLLDRQTFGKSEINAREQGKSASYRLCLAFWFVLSFLKQNVMSMANILEV